MVAREKASLETAQNAALCSVCRTPVRDATNIAPALQAGMFTIIFTSAIGKNKITMAHASTTVDCRSFYSRLALARCGRSCQVQARPDSLPVSK